MKPIRTGFLALVAACSSSGDAPAIPARCTDCDIDLRRVGVMADSFSPGELPDQNILATRDSRGRIYVITRKGDAVLAFNPDGTLAARIGKPGDGPGEFRRIRRALPGPGDSLFIADWGIARLSVYSPDLTFVRSFTLRHQPDLVLPDGRFIAADDFYARQGRGGGRVHLLGRDAAMIRAVGMDGTPDTPENEYLTKLHFARAANGDLWTVAVGRYRIDRWDLETGARKQTIDVASTWFKETAAAPTDESQRPRAVIESIWEGRDGLLWLALRDAAADWTVPPRAGEERAISPEEYSATHDWVIEAVDPNTAQVIASKRFPDAIYSRANFGTLITARVHEAAGSVLDVWEAVLVPKK